MARGGVGAIRRHPAGSGMKSLTNCQANGARAGMRTIRRPGWTRHEITHKLSSQWARAGMKTNDQKAWLDQA